MSKKKSTRKAPASKAAQKEQVVQVPAPQLVREAQPVPAEKKEDVLFEFEAMDATGAEIRDVIKAQSEEEAQGTIRQMGYFVTKIARRPAWHSTRTFSYVVEKNGSLTFLGETLGHGISMVSDTCSKRNDPLKERCILIRQGATDNFVPMIIPFSTNLFVSSSKLGT